MSVRKSSAYRISMIVLALVCLAGAGGIVYFTYFAKPSADVLLVKARQRYDDGQAAEKAGKPADAATAYAEAAVHAENGLNAVQERINKGALSKEDGRKLQGELWLLRARATRDRDYAKGAADGKPQEESFDTTLNEKYRSYGVLRDDKDRGTSVADLRNAFDANPADADLAKELLRVELTISPIDWQEVAKVCKTIVQKTPNDPRANYCLAREEFQQGGPRASDKSADRIREAETYLARAADNKSPYWRTTWLRLQILWWYVETAGKKKGKEFDERLADVRKALFEAKVGVLDRAASGEALAPLSPFDSEGLFGVHLFALRALTIDPSKPPEVADVRRVCDSALGMAQKLAESPSKDPHLPQAGAVVSEVLAAATAPLSKGGRSEWELVSAAARAFFEKYPAASSGIAGARVALLTAQEAAAARKRGDPAAKDLQDKAVATLEAGLKTATDQKKPADQLEYRLALLEVKWSDGAKLEEIEAHVAALRGIDLPVAKGVANYYDAHLSMRRGQLEKANKFFEAVLRDKAVPAFALRAHTALAELALTTGEPAAATLHLQQLVNAYSRFNDLPAADRQTLESRFADKDEVVGLQVVATLGAGLKRLERESRTDRERVKEDIVRSAEVLAKTLRVAADKDRPSPDRTARLALAQFRLAVGDRKEAGEALDRLAVDYPRSPEILRARVQFQMLPKAGTTDPEPGARENADRLIERFTRDNPDVRGGKLFWAEWLIRTGRAKEADQYLSSPVHFPDQKDQALNRLRAGALFQSGQREEAMKLLGALPADPTIDWVLLQAASTRDSRDAVLKSALGRYENNGLFRVYEAVTKLADKKFEAAAAELLTVVEYTALRQSARGLLERTFWAYADHDLKAATAYLTRLSADLPDEPAVYAGLATAARLNEDIGTPADTWPAKKTMYAALNKWEQLAVERQGKPGISPLAAGMSRIQFHLLAGNPVAARQDGAIGLSARPSRKRACSSVGRASDF